jgi:hemerythrin
MPIIECNAKFKLGIEKVDQCHKKLIECINTAFDEFAEFGQIKNKDSLVKALADHAAHNLVYEEKLLQESSYPALAEHQKEHDIFVETVDKLKGIRHLDTAMTVETLWFLVGWVTQHVRGSDVEASQYLRDRSGSVQRTEDLT